MGRRKSMVYRKTVCQSRSWCRTCTANIERGDSYFWDSKAQKAYCSKDCFPDQVAVKGHVALNQEWRNIANGRD